MEIGLNVQASEILNIQPTRKTLKKIIAADLNLLEKYFGTRILLEMPTGLYGNSPETIKILSKASKIAETGRIELKKFTKIPDEPHFFYYQAMTNGSIMGTGGDFFSQEKALIKSFAEAIERNLWRNHKFSKKNDDVASSSFDGLKGQALDIFKLAGFSDDQKMKNPNLRFSSKSAFRWVLARSLTEDNDVYCPIQLLSKRYFEKNVRIKTGDEDPKKEPMLRWPVSTGSAIGQNLTQALVRGIMEIIERDAFMITYMNSLAPLVIDFEDLAYQDKEIDDIYQRLKRYGLESHILKLPTDFPVDIVLAVIVDRSGQMPAVSVGAKADFNMKSSVIGAITECMAMRIETRSKFREEIIKPDAKIEEGALDRRGRILYWSRPENIEKIEFLTKGEMFEADIKKDQNLYEEKNKKSDEINLDMLVADLRKKNYQAAYYEFTTKEVRSIGMSSVQVIIPELQPMHLDESLPYLGGARLSSVPKKSGFKPASELRATPHPFP